MLLYRVHPSIARARPGHPGHPLHVPAQGKGRWDNPDLYRVRYLAGSAEAAVGEAFAHITHWSADMLAVPGLPGAERQLGTYRFDEESTSVLDLDDAVELVRLALRPTDVLIRNRRRTQGIAARVFAEHGAGLSWWSMHRPQWKLYAIWDHAGLTAAGVADLRGHAAVVDAAHLLSRDVDPSLSSP